MVAPKKCLSVLNPGPDSRTLCGSRDSAHLTKVRILRCGDHPGLSRWPQMQWPMSLEETDEGDVSRRAPWRQRQRPHDMAASLGRPGDPTGWREQEGSCLQGPANTFILGGQPPEP